MNGWMDDCRLVYLNNNTVVRYELWILINSTAAAAAV